MRILFIGSLNAKILAKQMQYYGIESTVISGFRWKQLLSRAIYKYDADLIYEIGLFSSIWLYPYAKIRRKPYVIHIVGSDAFKYAQTTGKMKKWLSFTLKKARGVVFVSEKLKEVMNVDGEIFPIPIDTKMFHPLNIRPKYDVLYYAPREDVYMLDSIIQYAKSHPSEKITVLGITKQNAPPNIRFLGWVPYEKMPEIYAQHKLLLRNTTHDGIPKMIYEAFAVGLKVIYNGKEITEIPEYMKMENVIPKLIKRLEELI